MTLPLTDNGQAFVNMMPRRVRDSYNIQAVQDVFSREIDRLDDAADDMAAQVHHQTATWGLYLHEWAVGLTQNPQTVSPSISDDFSSNTLSFYTYRSGGTAGDAVSGGALRGVGSLSTLRALVQTGYGREYRNGNGIAHFVAPADHSAGYVAGMIVRDTGTVNLSVRITDDGTNNYLDLHSDYGATRLEHVSFGRMPNGQEFWVTANVSDQNITGAVYEADPTSGGATPIASFSYTMTAGTFLDAHVVSGYVGIVFTPHDLSMGVLDWNFASGDPEPVSDEDRRVLIGAKLNGRYVGAGLNFVQTIQRIIPSSAVSFNAQTSTVIVKISANASEYLREQLAQIVDDLRPAHLNYTVNYTAFIAGISRAGDSL